MTFILNGVVIQWYDIAIALMCLVGAVVQFYGARLETRPCRIIKVSYGITMSLIFTYTLFLKILTDTHAVYPYALVLLLLNVLCGAVVRLWELLHTRRICRGCQR